MAKFCVLITIFVCLSREGLAEIDFVSPSSGSVIANLEGAKNATTLTCNVLNRAGIRTTTNWFLQNFRTQSTKLVLISQDVSPELFFVGGEVLPDDPTRTYRNELTFLNFTSDLDGVTVFCGSAINRRQAQFFLRVFYGLPGQPLNLSVENVEATSFHLRWNMAPVDFNSRTPISFYTINLNRTRRLDDVVVTNTTNNSTFFNVTGLLPGTTYELTVVAVSWLGEFVAKSKPSAPLVITTQHTVPALICNDPEFTNGGITVSWSYIHTSGQPLVSALVSYIIEEVSTVSDPVFISISDTETTSVNVSKVAAGVGYTFNITAMNNIGSSYIMCGPFFIHVGVPATPTFGELACGPNPGEVTIQIKTIASGADNPTQGFQFNILPVLVGVDRVVGSTREYVRNNYQSGEFETITVRDLQQGQSYTFSATAKNFYGTSNAVKSNVVSAGKGTLSIKVIGGFVGGILALVLLIVIVTIIIVVSILVRTSKKREKKHNVKNEVVHVIYDEPASLRRQYKQNEQCDSSINLNQCLAYQEINTPANVDSEYEDSSNYCVVKY